MNVYFPYMVIIDAGHYIRPLNLRNSSNREQPVAGEFAAINIETGNPVLAGYVTGRFYEETLPECTADYLSLRSRAQIQVVLSLPLAERILLFNTSGLITISIEAGQTILVPQHCYWIGEVAAGQFVISIPDKTAIELLVLRQTVTQLDQWFAHKMAFGLLPDTKFPSNQFSGPGKIIVQPFEKRQVISSIMAALSLQTISRQSLLHFLNWILVASWQCSCQKDLAGLPDANTPAEILRIYGAVEALILELDQSFSLPVFAKKLGMNPNIVQAHFKALFGYSVYRFLLLIRMEKAKFLLQEADLPIESIGLAVGYFNPGHFATVFKKVTGYSPSEIRNAGLPNTSDLPE
jgi:AraC-like DNA-binding protein